MSTPTKFDLHTHSFYSDGDLSPENVVVQASAQSVTHLALTDHDSVSGLARARVAAEDMNISLINGVEFSCHWRFQLVHLVGLDIDPVHAELVAGVDENKRRRAQRAQAIYEDLYKHGYDVEDEVARLLHDGSVPTRPHFAQALVNSGYAKDKKQAFKRFLVPGKPGFVAMQWPSLDSAAGWISAAGGVAVLAHPMRYKLTRTKLIQLIKDMKEAGVNAIEVATPITPDRQMKMLADLCLEYDLYASRGSDFHSNDQPWARLGGAPELPPGIPPVWQLF